MGDGTEEAPYQIRTAEDTAIRARDFAGALVGYNLGTLTNCSVTGSVNGHNYVGGLIGRNERAIKDFGTDVTVTGSQFVGGLVGINYGGLNNCYASGSVRAYGDDGGDKAWGWDTYPQVGHAAVYQGGGRPRITAK